MIQHLLEHRLNLYSSLQRGSNFQIYLPLACQEKQKLREQSASGNFAGRFVLIVDDDEKALDGLECQLRAWGCNVQTAKSLAETQIALVDNLAIPDLLITDFLFVTARNRP